LDINDISIFKLNKNLLNETPAIHPLSGPNSLLFNAKDKAELVANTYEHQFTENPGPTIYKLHHLNTPAYLLALC